jgi:hypothetical protein
MRILCRLGIHKWQYTAGVYGHLYAEYLQMASQPATRTCTRCPKKQVEEVHCLGLNPPQFLRSWHNT